MEGYQPTAACAECKGRCCKGAPCAAWPEDFGSTKAEIVDGVREAVRGGRYCLDWWEGDPFDDGKGDGRSRSLFVRPAVVGHEGLVTHPTWGGACTFLGVRGCSLPFDRRPKGGRMLEPVGGGEECIAHDGSKRGAVLAWYCYNLEALVDELLEER